MEIKLTPQESEEYFYSALCNGLGYVQSGYGLELTCDDNDYDEARKRLKNPCIEDVYMEILRGGKSLKMIDNEGGEDTKVITLQDVHERVQKTPIRHLTNMIDENDDAETADVILQTVFLGEVIYG